jgi:hypothetical protein
VGLLGRRAFLSGVAVAACARADGEERVPSVRGEVTSIAWSFDRDDERVVALVPAWGRPGRRFPLVVALNGRSEANLFPEHGVRAWPEDYNLVENIRRIANPPLRREHFEGNGDPARLAELNRDLAARPFQGVVVLCVFTPDIHLRNPDAIRAFGDFVVGKVLTRARRELPVITAPRSAGIAGWSIGGALAMRIGLAHADEFSKVTAIQPAVADDQIASFVEQARDARRVSPSLRLRAVSGQAGHFHPAMEKLARAWTDAGFDNEYLLLPGPHDYSFVRGHGALEMLFWHDRAVVGV